MDDAEQTPKITYMPEQYAIMAKLIRSAANECDADTFRAVISRNPGLILAALDIAAKSGWQPIEQLPPHQYAMVGRWCCRSLPNGGYWHEIRANWFDLNGERHWSYEEPLRPSPFYDDDCNYAGPTHFHAIQEPPK